MATSYIHTYIYIIIYIYTACNYNHHHHWPCRYNQHSMMQQSVQLAWGPTIHDHPTNLALTQVALILHLLTLWVCEIKVWAEALGGYDTQFGKVIYTETSSLQQLHWNQLPLAIEQQTGTDHNYILAHCLVLPAPTGDWGCWVHFHFQICIKWQKRSAFSEGTLSAGT